MYFEGSNNVTLLFDFWNVHGPGGMVLSVFIVLLLTVMYELLKVWKTTLAKQYEHPSASPINAPFPQSLQCFSPALEHPDSTSSLGNSPSETSLAPTENDAITSFISPAVNRWLHHSFQTGLHILQVVLGYMLMLCVMSYNIWIFLGIILGSLLGYFLAFPLLGYEMTNIGNLKA